MIDTVETADLAVVVVSNLMRSEFIVGARVCVADGEADAGSTFCNPKIDDFNLKISHRGISSTSESPSLIQKTETQSCRRNNLLPRLATEDITQGLDHGIASSSIVSLSSDGRQIQRKMGKVPRNGSGSFKKLRMLQTENLLPPPEADDTKMELDKFGMHLLKCTNTDKSATVRQKSNVIGRRSDKRNYKGQMKGRYDPLSIKAGLPSCSPISGGSNTFGMYGLKPDIYDITKLIDEISLDELLDGNYKRPTQAKDKGKKETYVNGNIIDSVKKACSVLRLQGFKQGKQTEEVDIGAKMKASLSSSPNAGAVNSPDGDESSLSTNLSKCSEDQEFCIKAEAPSDTNNSPLNQLKDIWEMLSLPPSKDLDSLLQDAVKPASSGKLTESRSGKQLSNCVTLPTFSWSNNFNGHYKSTTDATRISNKSTCQGRWVRIMSTATSIRSWDNESYLDLKSLTYDGSLVPAGQVKYRLPEDEKTLSTFISHDCCQQDLSSISCSTATLPPHASHSPTVLTAAQTLCDIASHCTKHYGIMRWPKQPSQKSMKARKSRSSEKNHDEFLVPTSETINDHVTKGVDYGSSKKPKISLVERREEVSNVQAVIGLSSVSAPRSSRSSPVRLSQNAVAETRHCNRMFTKPPFMVPSPPKVLDRSNNHPQKFRKVGQTDWNKTRS